MVAAPFPCLCGPEFCEFVGLMLMHLAETVTCDIGAATTALLAVDVRWRGRWVESGHRRADRYCRTSRNAGKHWQRTDRRVNAHVVLDSHLSHAEFSQGGMLD